MTTNKHNRNQIIIQPCDWEDIGDTGIILILQDDKGNKLQTDLTSPMVHDLIDKLSEAIETESV